MSTTLPKSDKKPLLNKHFDKGFVKSTLVFVTLLIVGFFASFAFSRQADIAKAFIPPQPIKSLEQIQKTTCFNQSGKTTEVSRGDFIYCEIQLRPETPELSTEGFQYNAILSNGEEKTSQQLIGSSDCSYNDNEQKLSCLNIPTETIPMGETRNISLSVSDLNKKEVVIFNTGVKILIN